MTKVITIVKYSFLLIGIMMLYGALSTYESTKSFLSEALSAEGMIVDVVKSGSSNEITYRPVIEFKNQDGVKIEFAASAGSNPPSYWKGQTVEVLYAQNRPQNASINDFSSLWAKALILGGMGAVFFVIGMGVTASTAFGKYREKYLRKHGRPIETQFISVQANPAVSVNGRSPFQVLTQWQDPVTADLYVFRSANVWVDPSKYLEGRKIRVFIRKNNPKQYFVDLSFLHSPL